MSSALLLGLYLVVAGANMIDVLSPTLLPPAVCGAAGCKAWSDTNSTVQQWFAQGVPANASNSCAQLGYAPGLFQNALDPKGIGSQGAWCMCADSSNADAVWGYCTSQLLVPEQVNLQLAGPNTVVVSFVTFEDSMPANAPQATLRLLKNGAPADTKMGVTHVYTSPSGKRTYYMHFVVFDELENSAKYEYSVASGGIGAVWSKPFQFVSPHAGGETSVAIFGDLGIYAWNNFQQMAAQAERGEISAVVHMGDHCYNIGGFDDIRGDGYMQAYEPIISTIPWIPVVGNHEFYDGDRLGRYLNQTEGTVVANPIEGRPQAPPAGHSEGHSEGHLEGQSWVQRGQSTATSALGYQLSAGNHHAAGVRGSTPSGTSRYFSVDHGLIHFVALDLNMYNAVDDCLECRDSQLEWLKQDLMAADANRANVPWIVAMSHFPLYCSNCPAPGHEPGAWWNSEVCEFLGHDPSCKVADPAVAPGTSGMSPTWGKNPGNADMVPDFEPLFMTFGVDVYASGHIHDYEWIYPTYNSTAVQQNFTNPRAPVHLVTGNGGPPSPSKFGKIQQYSYTHSTEYSYTHLIAHNASHMTWRQIANNDSRIIEELLIKAESHGSFPLPL